MMYDAIAEIGLADSSRLGVAQDEGLERLWPVGLGDEICLEIAQIVAEVLFECLDVGLVGLATPGALIGALEIVERADSCVEGQCVRWFAPPPRLAMVASEAFWRL